MNIKIEDNEFICNCGNHSGGSGWSTCNKEGYDQEPLINSNWNMTYRCNDCGIIYDEKNQKVLGYFTDWANAFVCSY